MKSFGGTAGERPGDATFWVKLRTRLLATRPHFFALPIGAALAGMGSTGVSVEASRILLAALIAGGGWATGQLWNDILDREADAIDAPDRAAVRGFLPTKATIAVALLLGASLLALLVSSTSVGWPLGLASMFLILTYNHCKAIPGLGNISHGALMGCAALVGASLARPDLPLATLVGIAPRITLIVAVWAALYLQGNYEKDVRGDAAAGYRTLAHVLGRRGSALARTLLALAAGSFLVSAVEDHLHLLVAASGVVAVLASSLRVALQNTEESPLLGYRWTVHGGTLGMLALGGPVLTPAVFLCVVALALALTEFAFSQSHNP